MATFTFSEANGTTIESIDSKWAGDTTAVEVQSGVLQKVSAPTVVAQCYYENGHGAYQSSQCVWKAGTATGNIRTTAVQVVGAQRGYEARMTSNTTIELRRNAVYVTDAAHGLDPTAADYTIKIETSDAGGGSTYVRVYVNGVQKISSTDASPVTGGYPAFRIANATAVTESQLDSWTDGVPVGPSITDVNTDEALSPGETATITGTGFGATQGAGGVKLTQEAGALESALTIIDWSDTEITATVNLGGLSFNATTSLVVTDDAAATGSIAVTFPPATGYAAVTLSGYPGTGYVIGEDASPAVVDGDQVEYESTASSGAGVTVNADGTFVLDTVDPATFSYRVRDNTDNTWSSWGTIRVNMAGGAVVTCRRRGRR